MKRSKPLTISVRSGDKRCFLAGVSIFLKDTKDLVEQEMPFYTVLAVVFSIAAMLFTMESTVLPFVFIIGIGFAVAYNFGTNLFLGEISYITKALRPSCSLAYRWIIPSFSSTATTRKSQSSPTGATRWPGLKARLSLFPGFVDDNDRRLSRAMRNALGAWSGPGACYGQGDRDRYFGCARRASVACAPV